MSPVKVCVVSGSRAEFGQLLPLLLKLNEDAYFELHFVVTGSHLSDLNGNTVSEIAQYPIPVSEYIPIAGMRDNTRKGIACQMAEVVEKFADYFSKNRPDLFIAIGDRYEMFGVGIAAGALLIPIVHICGGSTTSGAIDEVYRHSLTKMSQYHFTTCDVYRKRVIQLGENPEKVFNVGSLAIENCLKMELISEAEVKEFVGMPFGCRYCVVTFHPVSLEKEVSEKEVRELISAMDTFSKYSYIITLSNTDSGGNRINEMWREAAKCRENFYVVPSLGMKRYLSALKYAEMMIGNSSSGTTEGPAMHIPTIDIGDRQKGRFFAKSIVHCEPRKTEIVRAMQTANTEEFRKMLADVKNPFGEGHTSQKMIEILKQVTAREIEVKKDFFDVNFEVDNESYCDYSGEKRFERFKG